MIVRNSVRKIDAKLSQAALSGSIITEDIGEGSVSKGLWKTLTEGITSLLVIAEPENVSYADQGMD